MEDILNKLNEYYPQDEKYNEELAKELCVLFGVSKSFDSLIDRLEKASNIKYPNRPYTSEFRKSVELMWKGKEIELLMRVKKLEKEVNVC
jgi:hypothetical protein